MNMHDIHWEKMYAFAKRYYETYGHLLIHYDYRISEDGKELTKGTLEYDSESSIKLGSWIITQRKAYRSIGFGVMTEKRKQKLNSIGMVWELTQNGYESYKWERMYIYAKKYYEDNGNLLIPNNYCVDINGNEIDEETAIHSGKRIVKLGKWLFEQCHHYQTLPIVGEWKERFERLETIGMVWEEVPYEKDPWNNMFEYAKQYYQKHGHLLIPTHYRIDINGNELIKNTKEYNSKDSIRLGLWIVAQRRKYSADETEEWLFRKFKLNTIGMIWHNSDNRLKIVQLCEDYCIDLSSNRFLLNKSYLEILEKIKYLKDINQKAINNGILHPIFAMSDVNMQAIYGISMEYLTNKYGNEKCKVAI